MTADAAWLREIDPLPDVQWREEPVPLDIFVTDSAYLRNPPLSPIQYDAVRHAERIFHPATYLQLASSSTREVSAYWSTPFRMVNFLTMEWGLFLAKVEERTTPAAL